MRPLFGFLLVMALAGCAGTGANAPSTKFVSTAKNVDIANNDIVRIVTPFEDPRVVTTSDVEIKRSQHVLYVLPSGSERIAMFVTDAEDEAHSISLTLNPKPGGVREVDVLGVRQDLKITPSVAKVLKSEPTVDKADVVATTSGRKVVPWEGRPCKLCRDSDDNGNDYGGKSW